INIKASDFWIDSIPGLPESDNYFNQWAGHINVDNATESNIFFWLVSNQFNQQRQKLIIWLNGGPGCSSMDGVFMETGPYRLSASNGTVSVRINTNSWYQYANVLFVDQPVGTGFSYTRDGYATSIFEARSMFIRFLDRWLTAFPQFRKSEVYLAGESYAGVYIPYFARAMLDWGKVRRFHCKTTTIGNGWMDPIRQYDSYLDFALQNQLVSGTFLDTMRADTEKCRQEYSKGIERLKLDVCEDILEQVLAESRSKDGLCLNVYDIRFKDDTPSGGCGLYSWPPGVLMCPSYFFLNQQPSVVTAIHATGKRTPWVECDSSVFNALSRDTTPPSYKLLPELLEKLKVLVFVGDKDLICNNLGVEYMVGNLTWNGAKGFANAPLEWLLNGYVVGLNQTERNLTYVRIFGGSHMPAVESPGQVFEMMNRFMGVSAPHAPTSNDTWVSECIDGTCDVSSFNHGS
ncbi:alpha/beta-hydrolase, partial [Gonapodya prolifera JEL478]